tara:strand:+ start:3571 stop:3831 length:261 start_codon:yes stop_codon:yes gene_type:complete
MPEQKIILFENLTPDQKIKIAIRMGSAEKFYLLYFENLHFFRSQKECFIYYNNIHFDVFLEFKYSGFDSFKVYQYRRNKNRKNGKF